MEWEDISARALPVFDRKFGLPVLYSRLAVGLNDAVAPISLTKPVFSSAEYADPSGPFHASIGLKISAIPGGPQKGDIVNINGTDYVAMELHPTEDDWVDIRLRRRRT